MKHVAIIGAGFSSLSAACYLAKAGFTVEVFEKNDEIGGRARRLQHMGFTFDMGPTFYWMPDIFESFFSDFNKKPSDYYELTRLDPGYEVYYGKGESIRVRADLADIYRTFEEIEPGSSKFLKHFLREAEFNYKTTIQKVIYKPGKSVFELIMPETVRRASQFRTSISKKIRQYIRSERLCNILEFPVLFLGAKPEKTPAFYCFMNYADMVLGTWYVRGGMHEVVRSMQKLGQEYGVTYHTGAEVKKILIHNKKVDGLQVGREKIAADLIVSGADYHHTESLIDPSLRNYSEAYWNRKTMAPSALLFYTGFSKKLKNISHHTLFFDADFKQHASQIYDHPAWPDKPLFYASFPGQTDESAAPEGMEAAVFLIPTAPGIPEEDGIRDRYFRHIIKRMEFLTDQGLADSVLFYKSYGISDFSRDYYAYKGNAYGLANVLSQTAFLRPSLENKKIRNLFYTGQLTIPGPGVPPAIISGKIVSRLILSKLNRP